VPLSIQEVYKRNHPTKLVFTTPSHSEGIQQGEKRGKGIHLPIVSHYVKVDVPCRDITHYKSLEKCPPTSLDIFPKPHSIWPMDLIGTPPSILSTQFIKHILTQVKLSKVLIELSS
jgi:hypothetical protein